MTGCTRQVKLETNMETSTPEAAVQTAGSEEIQNSQETGAQNSADQLTDDEQGLSTRGTSSQFTNDDTTDNSDGSDTQSDDDLDKWAKSRGIEITTDGERKLAKMARDNQREFHQKRSEGKVQEEVSSLYKQDDTEFEDDTAKALEQLTLNQANLQAQLATRDFFDANPDAKSYEGKMAEMIKEERDKYGPDAARFLARDLGRLYVLAKSADANSATDTAVQQARKEERELLAKKTQAGVPQARASTNTAPKKQDAAQEILAMSTADWYKSGRQTFLDSLRG